jgi:hypothetical protein
LPNYSGNLVVCSSLTYLCTDVHLAAFAYGSDTPPAMVISGLTLVGAWSHYFTATVQTALRQVC